MMMATPNIGLEEKTMKRAMLTLLAVVLSVCMLVSLPVMANAESTAQQDGLLVSMETVGESFTAGEEIQISISIQNTNAYDMESISLESFIPEELTLVSGNLQTEDITISAGETYSTMLVVVLEQNEDDPENPGGSDEPGNNDQPGGGEGSPETGDVAWYFVTLMVLLVSVGAMVLVIRNKKAFKVFSLLLCLVMVATMIPANAFAVDAARETITVDKTVSIDGTDYTLVSKVSYIPVVEEVVTYTVTFNSNGGTQVEAQLVAEGTYAALPENPQKENFSFSGWYTDDGTFENAYNFNVPVDQDITLYAKWTPMVFSVAEGEDDSVSVYSITELIANVEDNTVTATVTAVDNCALIVRFIEEDVFFSEDYPANRTYIDNGELYASHVVAAGSDMTQVTAPVNGQLPDQFVAEAILIDGDGQPLCDPATSIVHTERYQQFQDKTVYDFDDNIPVLNFDASLTTNFGVLAEDVIVLEVEDVSASDTDDDGFEDLYRIVGSSQALQTADKVFATDGNDHYLFKVLSISVDGDAIVVTPADPYDETYGYSLVDFYQFIKVDMDLEEVGESEEDDNGESYRAKRWGGIRLFDVYKNISASTTLTYNPMQFETDHFRATAKISGTLSANLVLDLDVVLFGKTYMRCDLTYSTDTTTSIEIMAKWGNGDSNEQLLEKEKVNKTLKLGKISIPFGVTGLSAFADVKVMVEWEITAGVSLEVSSKTTSGFKFNTKSGYQKVDEKDTSWKVECKGHAEIKFGPKPSIGVEFLGGILSASIDCFFGGVAEAEAVIPTPLQGGDSIHGCYLCVEGSVKGVISVNACLKYKITKHITGKPIDWEIIKLEKTLFDFYLSLHNSTDSMFGGHIHGGLGSCPNQMYRTALYTKNINGQTVSEHVDIYTSEGAYVDSVSGGEYLYLKDGSYVAKSVIDDVACEVEFTINEGPKNVTLQPEGGEGRITGSVVDIDTGLPISGATILVYENAVNVATTATDANGSYTLDLEQGSYRIEVSKEGYIGASQNFTLRNGEQKHLETMKLTKRDDGSIMGGVYGTIKDGLTGLVVPDVSIQIVKGWSSEGGSADVVAELTTDSNGFYDYRKTTIMGVDFGLDAGNYTVVVSKDGYVTSSYNITVVGGEDMQFNGTITPEGADRTYRIVLTWGANPSDLDSHLNATYNSYREHIYYQIKNGYGGNLDVDDINSYGPETITIYSAADYTGDIKYSVHDYSNRYSSSSYALSNSGATVNVYCGAYLVETFYVPAGQVGNVWNVFYIDSYGNIVPVNTFQNISDTSSIYGQGGN